LLVLTSCSDDYLLEESLNEVVAEACAGFGGIEPEHFAEDVTAERIAIDVQTPSLFSPQRVLVVADARAWVEAPAPPGASAARSDDVTPLVEALSKGVPDDTALILGAWCGSRPKGKLVEAVKKHGKLTWISLPPAPKPWEDVALSDEQRQVLRGVVKRAAPGVRLSVDAANLLLERLGFAPRLLAQEVQKLATAAGGGQRIEVELVRQLTFPRERSLEVVRDAVLERDGAALLDLISAAAADIPLRDWRGQRLDPSSLAIVLLSQVANLLQQMLYLRRVAAAARIGAEMAPRKTSARGWYGRAFKGKIGAKLLRIIEEDDASPLSRSGKPPSEWTVGQLFAGAGHYRDDELIGALAEAGEVEAGTRSSMALEMISVWLSRLIRDPRAMKH
jgi:DNA polymerase III delta subunit